MSSTNAISAEWRSFYGSRRGSKLEKTNLPSATTSFYHESAVFAKPVGNAQPACSRHNWTPSIPVTPTVVCICHASHSHQRSMSDISVMCSLACPPCPYSRTAFPLEEISNDKVFISPCSIQLERERKSELLGACIWSPYCSVGRPRVRASQHLYHSYILLRWD